MRVSVCLVVGVDKKPSNKQASLALRVDRAIKVKPDLVDWSFDRIPEDRRLLLDYGMIYLIGSFGNEIAEQSRTTYIAGFGRG